MQKKDISTELWREYDLPSGRVYRIVEPRELYISDSGNHRIVDSKSVVHWILVNDDTIIRWSPRDNNAPVLF